MSITAQDRQDIRELCARYYNTTDAKDVDGFMDCWVDDDDILFESAFGNFSGRDEIRAFEEEHVSDDGMAHGKRHVLSNVVVEAGDDESTAFTSTYLIVIDVVNIPHIVATAHYPKCRVERTEDGWKFRHRKMNVDPGFQKLMEQQQQ